MTIVYGPFDSGPGANVTENFWRKFARLFVGTGVIVGDLNEFLAYGDSSGLQVKVKSGRAWIRGHMIESDAEVIMPIATADVTNPRIDRVVLSADFAGNTISILVLTGTPGASPSPPSVTQTEDVLWQISLAQIAVGAGVSTITAGNVTDERPMRNAHGLVSRVRTTDQTKTSSTTLSDDDTLFFWARAGEKWVIDLEAFHMGVTGQDIKFGWTVPAGSTGSWSNHGLKVGATVATDTRMDANDFTGTSSSGLLGASTLTESRIRGLLTAGADGMVKFRFAQATSGGGNTKMKADSHLLARRVA